MADYLIQDTTLDAIADAINAKTGGSSAMTPAEMVTAIGSISGGGGGWELIAEATATEDVNVLRVDIPSGKQNMTAYLVEYDCTLTGGTYGCPRFNSIAGNAYPAVENTVQKYTGVIGSNAGKKYTMTITTPYPSSNPPANVEYVSLVGYYTYTYIEAGSTIKVYGIGEPT